MAQDNVAVEQGSAAGFTYVTRSDRRSRKNRKGRSQRQDLLDEGQQLQRRLESIQAKKQELCDEPALMSFLDDVLPCTQFCHPSPVHSALALGLGSVKDARPAQIQLAFLLLLCDRLRISDIQAFDPIFGQDDNALLASLNVKPLKENMRGSHTLDRTTLVFMPHCTRGLYENLLRANWTHSRLSRLLLCCNTLDRYIGGLASSGQGSTPCLERAIDRLHVRCLPNLSDRSANALNDLAVQTFVPPSALLASDDITAEGGDFAADDSAFWVFPARHPQEDAELI